MTYFDYPENLTDINQTLHYVDEVTGYGFFGVSLLLIIFAISFMSLKVRYPNEVCLMSSMFTTTVVSILLWVLGILPIDVPPIMALVTAGAVAIAYLKGSEV